MKRRQFLKNSSFAGIGLASVSTVSCSTPRDNQSKTEMTSDNFILKGAGIEELQKKMESGELSSKSITELYLKRIQDIDMNGPELNSVIELNPDAMDIAGKMDRERKEGKVRGPMHGIPVIIKDNIDSGDKMMTTAGSLALEGHKAAKDAFIVEKLRESGAVLLGKANLSEWANFRSSRSSSGWSSRGGQTKCPYALDRNPSGSSAGSAVAVSADLCTVAIGTETDGSVVSPSSVNGVVGIKPTVGLLSRTGIIPISATQDTAGPMGKTVKDTAILLGALIGVDKEDVATLAGEGKYYHDYTQFLDTAALAGKRIGVEKSFFHGNERVVALFRQAIEIMRNAGAVIVETDLLAQLKGLGNAEFTVLLYEFKDGLNRYFLKEKTKVTSLADVIKFNTEHADKTMPFFMQDILESSQEKGDLKTPEYLESVKKSTGSATIISDYMKDRMLDAISVVTNGPAWLIDHVNGDCYSGLSFSTPPAISGFPHITVPMGQVFGLPCGLTFTGLPWSEPMLIGMAYAYEQAAGPRPVPQFLKTANI